MPTKTVQITPAIIAWVRRTYSETPIAIRDDGSVMWVTCESGSVLTLPHGEVQQPDVPIPEPEQNGEIPETPPPTPQQRMMDQLLQEHRTYRAERRRQQREQQQKRDNDPQPKTPRGERQQEPDPLTLEERWAIAEARCGESLIACSEIDDCDADIYLVADHIGEIWVSGNCEHRVVVQCRLFDNSPTRYVLCENHGRMAVAKLGSKVLDADD